MLMHDKKYMSLEPRIPLYVSGFGPRAMELAGEYGDGLVFAIPPRGVRPGRGARPRASPGASAGRPALDGFHNCALTNVALLEPGEPADSERVLAHGRAERHGQRLLLLRRGAASAASSRRPSCGHLEALLRAGGGRPRAAHRHFRTHEFHYTYLHPGEAELIDADLVRATCLVGTADELIERIQELERQRAAGADVRHRRRREVALRRGVSRRVMARV